MFYDYFVPKYRSYPDPAVGWDKGVYYEREEKITDASFDSFVKGDMLAIPNRMWTETENTGFGIYPFINSVIFTHKSGLKDGKYTVTFANPTDKDYLASAYANNMLVLNKVEVPAGKDVTADFSICSIEEETTIQFFIPSDAVTFEDTVETVLYIKDFTYNVLPAKAASKKPTVFIASDSTVQSYEEFYAPQTGWGQVFSEFFKSDNVEPVQCTDKCYPQCHDYECNDVIIENRSIGARSARSFITEGKWDALLKRACPGDYCIIQWAHNDATAIRPNRYVAPGNFQYYLRKYVNSCRARGIFIMFVTPVSRRNCDEHDGKFLLSFEKYRDGFISVGEEMNVPVFDLCKESCDYLNEIGPDESKLLYLQCNAGDYPDGAYADGVHDNVHLQRYGALIYARMVANGIKNATGYPELDKLAKSIDTTIAIEKPIIKPSTVVVDPEVPSAFALQELHVENKIANFLLIWNDVEGATSYNVYRKGSVDFQFFPLRSVTAEEKKTAAVLPFTLPGADVYQVRVTAVFADGTESKPSRTIEFRA